MHISLHPCQCDGAIQMLISTAVLWPDVKNPENKKTGHKRHLIFVMVSEYQLNVFFFPVTPDICHLCALVIVSFLQSPRPRPPLRPPRSLRLSQPASLHGCPSPTRSASSIKNVKSLPLTCLSIV